VNGLGAEVAVRYTFLEVHRKWDENSALPVLVLVAVILLKENQLVNLIANQLVDQLTGNLPN